MYYVIYDGNCNLCVTFVRRLEAIDRGQRFTYIPMQATSLLQTMGISPTDCQQGMILIDAEALEQRWQGSAAAEEIGRLLPLGASVVDTYRAVPGLKWLGDRVYELVRDRRYDLFGGRSHLYQSAYPACLDGHCPPLSTQGAIDPQDTSV